VWSDHITDTGVAKDVSEHGNTDGAYMLQLAAARFQKLLTIPTAYPADGSKVNRRVIVLVAALATMVAYFVPFLLLGNNAYITIHDNLDGEFVDKYLLVATGKALIFDGSSPIENIMNGLPRAALPSGLDVAVLLFYIFPPVWAYIVNFILVHVIAFCGMFLLLRKHFLTDEDDYLLAGAISICFFLVPYYTTHGLTVAGQPLLAYAFLNIRNGQRNWKDYLIILLFPLWSDIALIAPFAVTTLLLILAIDWVRSHSLNKHFLISIVLFASAYIALQYQLINSVLGSNTWVSHRTTWNRWTDFDVSSNMKRTLEMLFTTQYHTGSFSTLPVIVAAGGALVLLIARKRRAGLLDVMAIGVALICLEYGFYDWIVLWFGWLVPGLQTFNASRYYFLLPLLWMLVFALSLKELKRRKWGLPIGWCLVVIQAFAVLKFNTEYKDSARLLVGKHVYVYEPSFSRFFAHDLFTEIDRFIGKHVHVYEPSFSRFFAHDLFTEIDRFIGRPKDTYRVVTIGMHPSVAEFNGFYTLDSYQRNYPLSYKRQFRQIIWKELDRDTILREYFDGWGNRCYVFSSELGLNFLCYGKEHHILHNLQLDTAQLRAMGCEYVISAAEIENSAQRGLRLERQFFSPESFWHIYLYYVLPTMPAHVAPANQTQNAAASKQIEEANAFPGAIERSRKGVHSIQVSGVGSVFPQQICKMYTF